MVPHPPTSPRPPEAPPGSPSHTPPNSPRVHGSPRVDTIERFEHAVEKLTQALKKVEATTKREDIESNPTKHIEAEKPKTRASKLEYKLVDEVWDTITSKYKIVDSSALPEAVTDLDEHVFVVRARTGKSIGPWKDLGAEIRILDKKTFEQEFYIDVKSDKLRDVLRVVLREVRGLSLREDNITLEQNLLYHYVPELEAYSIELEESTHDDAKLKHIKLLALFKPSVNMYTTILDAEKPACYRYDSGKQKTTTSGVLYFYVECRCLDFNGQVFGEVSTALGIRAFQGAKPIDRLEAYPLEFHRHQEKMREYFVRCGRQFVSLIGQHHVQYRGNAFYLEKGDYVEVPVDSRIMVDVAYFRKVNPNYARPQVNELARSSSSDGFWILWSDTEADEVKSNGLDTKIMSEDDLMICSQTVYGWSFGNKRWRKSSSWKSYGMEVVLICKVEFVVDDAKDIVWNQSSFDNLAIPVEKKKVITALAKAHISRASGDVIDDFVVGKGQGLITLLQYEIRRLLPSNDYPSILRGHSTLQVTPSSVYVVVLTDQISAGELGQDPKTLEEQLTTIFRLAHHWKAILLLDEADVFIQSRSFVNQHNALVSIFLRTLEYYRGIMVLTTNRVKDIDDAIQSRISVALHYGPLGLDTRKMVWESFLEKAATVKGRAEFTPLDLDWLSKKEVNGRQIKNIITTAHALAVDERVPLSRSHLEVVMGLDKEFQKDYSGAGQIANNLSYA
ncbi:MAG: hypothetical protein Q9168_003977 [Polycauliona sp. 1 TL-2023]